MSALRLTGLDDIWRNDQPFDALVVVYTDPSADLASLDRVYSTAQSMASAHQQFYSRVQWLPLSGTSLRRCILSPTGPLGRDYGTLSCYYLSTLQLYFSCFLLTLFIAFLQPIDLTVVLSIVCFTIFLFFICHVYLILLIDDVRRISECARKGIKEALSAGSQYPCLYVCSNEAQKRFPNALSVAVLGVLQEVYLPMEYLEWCQASGKSVSPAIKGVGFAVPAAALAQTNQLVNVLDSMEKGRRVARSMFVSFTWIHA
jgi:hypothetical protein